MFSFKAWCSANDITFDDGDKFNPDATEEGNVKFRREDRGGLDNYMSSGCEIPLLVDD